MDITGNWWRAYSGKGGEMVRVGRGVVVVMLGDKKRTQAKY